MSLLRRLAALPWWRLWGMVGLFVGLGLAADLGLSAAIERESHAYLIRQLGAIGALAAPGLQAQPIAQRAGSAADLDARFDFPVALEPMRAGERRGPDADGRRWREPLAGGQTLVLGPVALDINPEYRGPMRWLLGLRIGSAALFTLLAGALALAWMQPLRHDLRQLRQAARGIEARRWQTRVGAAASPEMRGVHEAFDTMARRTAEMVERSREMAGAIGHELRTPIARVRFAVDAMREEAPGEAEIAAIEADLAELESLIDASLTWSRLERDDLPLRLADADLGAWLHRQAGHLQPLAAGKSLTCRAPERLAARFDPALMAFAVRNGVRNALKYANREVRISAEIRDADIVIHIDDDGPGVPVEWREAVFEPYRRLDRDADARQPGWGLGLAVARRVMSLHGGSARMDESEGSGARLELRLPAGQ